MKKGRLLIIMLILVSLAGVGFGVFYLYFYEPATEPVPVRDGINESILKEYTTLKIFYPAGNRLELVEKKVPGILSPIKTAEILINEYLDVSGKAGSGILPEGTRVDNIFISSDGVVYLDFNREFSRNFQGDVLDEYMLLKSIFNTILGNLDVRDVMILINGKEAETIGGHLLINRPLKEIVTQEMRFDE
ncbi:MAG TPA: hypothetical protein ENJ04_05745 [Nitrospirae bacterium]|nr:hypothetical protein [Nitrospirota bacterium]